MKRTTLRDIAIELGLSTQAVSMALRDHNRISEATRQRVKAKAEEMNYRVDPALQSLVAYRRRNMVHESRWNQIALVHDWKSESTWRNDPYAKRFREGLYAVAQRRGIKIETEWLGHRSERSEAALRRIYTKGISGLIVAPHSLDVEPTKAPIPKTNFQIVTCGPEHLYEDYLTVQVDYYENLRIAWDVLWRRGFRRIGFAYQQIHGWRTGDAWRGAYHIEKRNAGFKVTDLPVFCVDEHEQEAKDTCIRWVNRHKLDAIIASSYKIYDWANTAEKPPFVAEMNPLVPERSGIETSTDELCKCLLDTLSVAMQDSLTSEKTFPYRVHIPGRWRDGARGL